jgi:hypothetical protein
VLQVQKRDDAYDNAIAKVKGANESIIFLNTRTSLCDSKYCYAGSEDEIWYQTRDHLTPSGGRKVVASIGRQLPRTE